MALYLFKKKRFPLYYTRPKGDNGGSLSLPGKHKCDSFETIKVRP
jgi:hypothetical protein